MQRGPLTGAFCQFWSWFQKEQHDLTCHAPRLRWAISRGEWRCDPHTRAGPLWMCVHAAHHHSPRGCPKKGCPNFIYDVFVCCSPAMPTAPSQPLTPFPHPAHRANARQCPARWPYAALPACLHHLGLPPGALHDRHHALVCVEVGSKGGVGVGRGIVLEISHACLARGAAARPIHPSIHTTTTAAASESSPWPPLRRPPRNCPSLRPRTTAYVLPLFFPSNHPTHPPTHPPTYLPTYSGPCTGSSK